MYVHILFIAIEPQHMYTQDFYQNFYSSTHISANNSSTHVLKMLNAPIISIILELNRIKNNPYDSCAKCSVHYIQYNNTKVPSILTAKCNLLSITKSLQAIYRDFTELEYCNLALACCIYRNSMRKNNAIIRSR